MYGHGISDMSMIGFASAFQKCLIVGVQKLTLIGSFPEMIAQQSEHGALNGQSDPHWSLVGEPKVC
jgi:hypothetical protein